MAGIAGAASFVRWEPEPLVKRMAKPLIYHAKSRAEHWQDAYAGLCRVRSGDSDAVAQPIFSRRTGKCIVFFGECLDYENEKRNLAHKGHEFEYGNSDAEYCLRLYEEYGENSFASLSGSFCFAVYDSTTRELLLVSDRLGSRPLFHGIDADGVLVFATQVSAVLENSKVSRALDVSAVLEFCAIQRVLGQKTYHEGVKLLPPASVLRFANGRVAITPYRILEYRTRSGSVDEYSEDLAATVRRAVGRVTRGSARTGLLLSGGLDARMIVAAAERELTCYTFGDYENFESQTAKCVAEAKGFPFRFLQRHPDQYASMVEIGTEIGSGMHPFNHAHALGFIEIISRDCDVVTHGYGTEILFRGTSLPRVSRTTMGLDNGKVLDHTLTNASLPHRMLARGYNLRDKGVRELLTPSAANAMDETLANSSREIIELAEGHAPSIYDRFLWPDLYYRGRFPSFLFELSLRPFMTERSIDFDNEIIDLHLRMPVDVRADNRLWLKAMERLNRRVAHVISANTGYSPFTPAPVVSAMEKARALVHLPSRRAQKSRGAGGSGSVAHWGLSPISWPRFDWMIRNNSKLRQLIVDTLSEPEALPPHIFEHSRVQGMVSDHLAGRCNNRDVLFALLTFGRWNKRYGC